MALYNIPSIGLTKGNGIQRVTDFLLKEGQCT